MIHQNKLGYIMEYKKYIIFGFVIVLIQMMIIFAVPIVVRQIIDQAEMGNIWAIKNLVIYVFMLITALFVLKIIRNYFFVNFSFNFKTNESKKLFHSLFKVNLFTVAKNGPTYYTERIYNGLLNMFNLVGDVSIRITTIVITVILSLVFVFFINSIFSILFFLLIPLTYFAYRRLNSTLQTKSEKLQRVNAMNFKHIINLLQNFTEIKKIFNYEIFSSLCKKYISRIEKENNDVAIYAKNVSNSINFFTDMIKHGILIFAIYLLILGRIGIAEVIFVEMILMIYTASLSDLTNININLRDINAFQNFVNDEILSKVEIDEGIEKLKDIDTISFKVEHFNYDEKKILQDINLEMRRGECIGIVGDSGCGKSTLLNLLVRLYEANGIYINGTPIQKFTMKSLRENIYIVSQTPYIFPGTIEENLLIGLEDIKNKRKDMIFNSKFFRNFIREFPQKEETQIQEGASNFSGGQKQKIMIIRALLRDPQVLILDEATSEMDGAAEKDVMNFLFNEKSNKIIIIVSHRLSTIKKCNKIAVLKKGYVSDYGNLEYLKDHSAEFYRLFESQLE